MNPSSPENAPLEPNPFAAPSIESLEVDTPENALAPSLHLVWGCIAVGVLAKLFISYEYFVLLELEWGDLLGWMVGEALAGVVVGLGLAMLLHALSHRRLNELMPGHWRLVAFSAVIVGDLLYAIGIATQQINGESESFGLQIILQQGIEAMLAAAFYAYVVRTTKERPIWRIYAWLCLVYYALDAIAPLLSPFWFDGFGQQFVPFYLMISSISNLIALGILLVLVVAAALDFSRKVPRDTYHYLGLILPVAVLVLQFFLNLFPYGL